MAEHKPYPPNATHPPQTRIPWPLIAIILVGVLIVVIFLAPGRQNRATVTATLEPNALHIFDEKLAPDTVAGTGGNVDVYGQLTNNGDLTLTDALLSAEFKDNAGTTVYVAQQPIRRVEVQNGGKSSIEKSFTEDPLRPRQTANFMVSYSQVPANWNHQPPQLTVLQARAKR